jgi:hypothetical protein
MTRLFATAVAEQQPMDFDRCPMVERSTVAGGQRKQFNGLPAGIEGCDGFPPLYVYIFFGCRLRRAVPNFYTRARKNYRNSRVTARLALCHRHYLHITNSRKTISQLSQPSNKAHKPSREVET